MCSKKFSIRPEEVVPGADVYELKLQKAHAFRHGMNAAYFFF